MLFWGQKETFEQFENKDVPVANVIVFRWFTFPFEILIVKTKSTTTQALKNKNKNKLLKTVEQNEIFQLNWKFAIGNCFL